MCKQSARGATIASKPYLDAAKDETDCGLFLPRDGHEITMAWRVPGTNRKSGCLNAGSSRLQLIKTLGNYGLELYNQSAKSGNGAGANSCAAVLVM